MDPILKLKIKIVVIQAIKKSAIGNWKSTKTIIQKLK